MLHLPPTQADGLIFTWAGGSQQSERYSGRNGYPGTQLQPPLRIDADSFEMHFTSDRFGTEWGYRWCAWAEGPHGWVRCTSPTLGSYARIDSPCLCSAPHEAARPSVLLAVPFRRADARRVQGRGSALS